MIREQMQYIVINIIGNLEILRLVKKDFFNFILDTSVTPFHYIFMELNA